MRGSAAAKRAVDLPELIGHLERLGKYLTWHGGLSVDAVVDETHRGTIFDINPRLVEPVSSELAGIDLIGRMLAVSLGEPVGEVPSGGLEDVRERWNAGTCDHPGRLGVAVVRMGRLNATFSRPRTPSPRATGRHSSSSSPGGLRRDHLSRNTTDPTATGPQGRVSGRAERFGRRDRTA